MSTISRDAVERRLFGVLRPLIIVVPARDHASSPSTTWCCCRSGRSTRCCRTRARCGPSRARSTSAPTATCSPRTEDGGQGFLTFIKNSFIVAIGTVVLTLLVAIPGPTP